MKRMVKFVGRCLILFPFFLNACQEKEGDKSHDAPSRLVMGTSADSPPFEFHTPNDPYHPIGGFDIDVAQALGEVMGVTVEVQDMDFSALVPALTSGRIDFVMASMTPTVDRARVVDFSQVYYQSALAIVAPKDRPIEGVTQMAGKHIGVQMGSTHEVILRDLVKGGLTIQIVPLNKLGEMIQDIKAGRLDGAVMEASAAKAYTHKNSDLTYRLSQDHQAGYAIAVPKNSPLTNRLNQALKTIQENGTLDRIVAKWLAS